MRGRQDMALNDLTKAIELDPKLSRAYGNRGTWYVKQRKWDQAMKDLDTAVEIDPGDPAPRRSRAAVHAAKGHYSKAWADVKACQRLGGKVHPMFLAKLRKASGREE